MYACSTCMRVPMFWLVSSSHRSFNMDSIDRIACVVLKFVHSGVKYHYNITLDDKIVI